MQAFPCVLGDEAEAREVFRCIENMVGRSVGETRMIQALNQSTFAPIRSIAANIDGIGGGTSRGAHKYQYPLMVTIKRLMNALCAVIPLAMHGTLLNMLPTVETSSVLIALAYVIDVNTSQRVLARNSMSILYQHLKGCSETAMWTGEVKGNVLNVRVINGERKPIQISHMLRKVAAAASTTDKSLRCCQCYRHVSP